MKIRKHYLTIFCFILVFMIVVDLIRMMILVTSNRTRTDQAIAFQQIQPQAALKIIFLGDSTAVGTGSADPQDSVAGRFGKDFPQANLVNMGFNGQKIRQLAASVDPRKLGQFDLVVVQIGANDIIRFTNMKEVERDLRILLSKVTQISPQVVLLHSGDVGAAPFFSRMFSGFLTMRTFELRELYMRYALLYHVTYVDLLGVKVDDVFLKDIERYYSHDLLHPSGEGYGVWYQAIRSAMEKSDIHL